VTSRSEEGGSGDFCDDNLNTTSMILCKAGSTFYTSVRQFALRKLLILDRNESFVANESDCL
jgi:hypothetical protein